MRQYIVSFRIDEETEDATAARRRQSLYDAVEALQSNVWKAPTSFYIFETWETNTKKVLERLTASLNEDVDVVFIRKVDFKDTWVWGAVGQDGKALDVLVPGFKRLKG